MSNNPEFISCEAVRSRFSKDILDVFTDALCFIRLHPKPFCGVIVANLLISQLWRLTEVGLFTEDMELLASFCSVLSMIMTFLYAGLLFGGWDMVIGLMRGEKLQLPSPWLRVVGNVLFYGALVYALQQFVVFTLFSGTIEVLSWLRNLSGGEYWDTVNSFMAYPSELTMLSIACLCGFTFVGSAAGDSVSFKEAYSIGRSRFWSLLFTVFLWLKAVRLFMWWMSSTLDQTAYYFSWLSWVTHAVNMPFFIVVTAVWYEKLRLNHKASQVALVTDANYDQCQD